MTMRERTAQRLRHLADRLEAGAPRKEITDALLDVDSDLRIGLPWCEAGNHYADATDADNNCRECAGEANRNRRALSRS